MPGPIGYTPPANPYSAMPIEPGSFHGSSPLPAMGAAQAAMAPAQALIQKSQEYDTQAAQAAKFQKLLQSGLQGMQSYVQDVAKTNPELAAQFTQEMTTFAPMIQGLKGKELPDFAFNVYDSWNGRLGGAKVGSAMAANPDATMPELLGKTNGSMGAKDMLTLKSTDEQKQMQAKWYQSKIDWNTQLPGLKRELQKNQVESRERMTRFRTQAASNKNNLDPTVARAYLTTTLEEIKATQAILARLEQDYKDDPVMAGVGQVPASIKDYHSRLKELEDDRDFYQKSLGGSAVPGTAPAPGAGSGASGAGYPKPVVNPDTLTATSSDEAYKEYLRNWRDPKTNEALADSAITPAVIQKMRERKAKAAP